MHIANSLEEPGKGAVPELGAWDGRWIGTELRFPTDEPSLARYPSDAIHRGRFRESADKRSENMTGEHLRLDKVDASMETGSYMGLNSLDPLVRAKSCLISLQDGSPTR